MGRKSGQNRRERWGSKLNGHETPVETAVSILAAGTLLHFGFPDVTLHLRESGYNLRQAYNTVSDAAHGGPQGMRAARSLEEAIALVTNAGSENTEAARALEQYYQSRGNFATELLNVYTANETLARVAGRAGIQLKGAAKNFFEVGNDLKGDWWKTNIDGPITVSYGRMLRMLGSPEYKGLTNDQIIAKALESSENLKKFYTEARKFYDSREKAEEAANAFCSFLEETVKNAEAENIGIEKMYPGLIGMVRQGYNVEDYFLALDKKGIRITGEDLANVGKDVKGHEAVVADTRGNVAVYAPLPKHGPDWIGIATNPFMLAMAGYVLVRGVRTSMLPRFVDNGISRAVCYPLKQALNGANKLYDTIHNRIKGNPINTGQLNEPRMGGVNYDEERALD